MLIVQKRYGAAARLARQADALFATGRPLPTLFAFTDPERTGDSLALARQLPAGAGLILRTFGRDDLANQAPQIAQVAREEGLVFLIAAEPELALSVGADGVHWPNRLLPGAPSWTNRFPIMSASAHSPSQIRRAQSLVDLIFVSAVFTSNSASATHPIGVHRLARMTQRAQRPIYALGGINTDTIKRLTHLNLSGIGAIDGVMDRPPAV